MSVSLPVSVLKNVQGLFSLLATKGGAFIVSEYTDVGNVNKRVAEAIQDGKDSGQLPKDDCKYILAAITVCSQRVPIEFSNYRGIVDIMDKLSAVLKDDSDDESKTDL